MKASSGELQAEQDSEGGPNQVTKTLPAKTVEREAMQSLALCTQYTSYIIYGNSEKWAAAAFFAWGDSLFPGYTRDSPDRGVPALRGQPQATAGAISNGELRPRTASRKARCHQQRRAGAANRGQQGPLCRTRAEKRGLPRAGPKGRARSICPLPARPSHWRRRRARRRRPEPGRTFP